MCTDLVERATSELELRYEAKIRRAREMFAVLTDRISDSEKAAVVASQSAAPLPSRWLLYVPTQCPACKSPPSSEGATKVGITGISGFSPRFFGCRVCKLTLTGLELELAGMQAHSLRTEEEVDDDWEPDFDM